MEEIKQEESIIKCKTCSKEVVRVLVGKYPNGKDKKWADKETGKLMNGSVCSKCHADKQTKLSSIKRQNKSLKDNSSF